MSSLTSEKMGEDYDVVIIGAGVSGINCAYRLQTEVPDARFAIFENRDDIGGTWDLFHFPGLRADTAIYTYAFAWHPWSCDSSIADAASIRTYLADAVSKYGIRKNIRLRQRVISLAWSLKSQQWTVLVRHEDNAPRPVTARFIVMATGYYDYEQPLQTHIPGLERFAGKIIHPQFWPDGYDYSNKKLALIGSGSTSVTMFPVLAEKATAVTLIQRSPSYIHSGRGATQAPAPAVGYFFSRIIPHAIFSLLARMYFILAPFVLVTLCRSFPRIARHLLRKEACEQLPTRIPYSPHFTPRYNVWDQRVCICPRGDFYRTFHRENVNIVTGSIETVTQNGVRMVSGESVEADVIITATGLKMVLGGGVTIQVDGEDVELRRRLLWNGAMLDGIPNMVYMMGYTDHAWTLGADNTAIILSRLLKYMKCKGIASVVPQKPADHEGQKTVPMWSLDSTYSILSRDELPVYGMEGPWKSRTKAPFDMIHARWGNVTNGLRFTLLEQ